MAGYADTQFVSTFNRCSALEAENEKQKKQLTKAKELLRFWVNNFYDSFNKSTRYEERHKALEQSEQFLKEIEQ